MQNKKQAKNECPKSGKPCVDFIPNYFPPYGFCLGGKCEHDFPKLEE